MIKEEMEMRHPLFKLLKEASDRGNTVCSIELFKYLKEKLKLTIDKSDIDTYEEQGLIGRLQTETSRYIADGWTLHNAATIALFAKERTEKPSIGLKPSNSMTSDQRAAIERLDVLNKAIVLGPAGCGKTYLASLLIKQLLDLGKVVKIAAPTGKAATVLSQKVGVPVRTIHSLLGLQPGSPPDYDESNPIQADVVIIDEASMIDDSLFSQLIRALRHNTCIYFFGDINQLPPVQAGRPIYDLYHSKQFPTIIIKEIVRQSKDSGIIKLAHSILAGKPYIPTSSDVRMYTHKSDEIMSTIEKFYRNENIDPNKTLLITPVKKKTYTTSTKALNILIASIVNPVKRRAGSDRPMIGDRIIFTVNDYKYGFVNGETGFIRYDGDDRIVSSDFGREYNLDDVTSYELGYALTVHKAQGSEADHVIIVVPSELRQMYSPEFIYTAITRAKKTLTVIGDINIFLTMARGKKVTQSALSILLSSTELTEQWSSAPSPYKAGWDLDATAL